MSKWIASACLAGLVGWFGSVRAADADIEYSLLIEPGVAGVSVIACDKQTGKKTQIVRGAQSIDEAIRQAMLRTGKPLVLKFSAT